MKQNIFIMTLAAILFAACGTQYKSLPMDEFESAISKPDVTIVDVRTPQEYAEGHIVGAINIDWKSGNFGPMADELLDDDETIAVYCIHANRSKQAAEQLVKMGFDKVIELDGGLEAWINAGKPIEKGVCIDFIEAKNYFLRNDAPSMVPPMIDRKSLFDSCFGTATTMGEDGMPTAIDFEKQFVLTVVDFPTNKEVEIDAERLIADDVTLALEYSVEHDEEELSYTQTPILLVVVDRQYMRPNMGSKRVPHK